MKTGILLLMGMTLLLVVGCNSGPSRDSASNQIGNMSDTSKTNVIVYRVFPSDNTWNKEMSQRPQQQDSSDYVTNIFTEQFRYMFFGFASCREQGIPDLVVSGRQANAQITLVAHR